MIENVACITADANNRGSSNIPKAFWNRVNGADASTRMGR